MKLTSKAICPMLLYSTLLLLATTGCGGSANKVIHGTVTCGSEKNTDGNVCFVPVEGTAGPPSFARIVDGQYRIEERGGVPVGKYRVEVTAKKKTGRQVVAPGRAMGERVTIDEMVLISPMQYAGKQSPLIVEVPSSGDGLIDIKIPARRLEKFPPMPPLEVKN